MSANSFGTQATLTVGDKTFTYHSLATLEAKFPQAKHLPFCLKILLENLLRNENGLSVFPKDVESLAKWNAQAEPDTEIAFTPARVLLQDFTGVPCVVDLAAMRDGIQRLGGDPAKINPLVPCELVIDHSVQVDEAGTPQAFEHNTTLEYERNHERYVFLRWGQNAFRNFKVVPPETGIVHQVNLEYLARVTFVDGKMTAYPDTLVGTDSHTTMVNGLGVLGWGVGGIEAEAAMLGQPVTMLIPQVVGFKMSGHLREGTTATDLVLTVTQMLRKKGVVGKFVEFFGDGIAGLSLADRATIANMAPEYGATCGIFPVDAETLRFLRTTGRPETQVELVEAYFKAQGMFHAVGFPEADYTDVLELDLTTVEPSLAGPSRPQDRVALKDVKTSFAMALPKLKEAAVAANLKAKTQLPLAGQTADPVDPAAARDLHDGSVVIAAITSCTNTSNPSVMMAAGLVAQKAAAKGLHTKPWVKTSLSPGSKVVTDYLAKAGLLAELEKQRFHLAGFGCMTCIGNSGPLPEAFTREIHSHALVVTAVLSGNRNFEGRVHADVRANYLASPPLVVAYALAGRVDINWDAEPVGRGSDGTDVYLKDIWPTQQEVADVIASSISREAFERIYGEVYAGDEHWRALQVPTGDLYAWEEQSTYIANPPYFDGMTVAPPPVGEVTGARVLALAGQQHHDRPHLPGRQHRQDLAGGEVPHEPRRRAEGLQPVRCPPRQPPGDGPRHVRQRPAAQPARAGRRRRRHAAPADRRADVDLRRLDALPNRGHAADGHRRHGVRQRVEPRLGRQGDATTRSEGGAGRELRAHPPQQPRRHGRVAAAVQARPGRGVARPDRRGDLRHRRPGPRPRNALHDHQGPDHHRPPAGRHRQELHRRLPHRHAAGSALLPARRHSAVCAAAVAEQVTRRSTHSAASRLRERAGSGPRPV